MAAEAITRIPDSDIPRPTSAKDLNQCIDGLLQGDVIAIVLGLELLGMTADGDRTGAEIGTYARQIVEPAVAKLEEGNGFQLQNILRIGRTALSSFMRPSIHLPAVRFCCALDRRDDAINDVTVTVARPDSRSRVDSAPLPASSVLMDGYVVVEGGLTALLDSGGQIDPDAHLSVADVFLRGGPTPDLVMVNGRSWLQASGGLFTMAWGDRASAEDVAVA